MLFISKNIRLLLGLAVVILIFIVIATALVSRKDESPQVSVNDHSFNVEIAKSDKEKQIGLSEKDILGENDGMLFVFDNLDYHSFWMRNMKFPIDIIYINGTNVNTIFRNASPSSSNKDLIIYQPKEKSDKVFEVNSGTADKYNIKEGTSLDISNL